MSASQTLLGMVNSVLVELRETQVTTVNYSTYSTLIAKWINDCKRQVEDAWDWQPLNYELNFPLVLNQVDYDLTAISGGVLNARARHRMNPYNRNLSMGFDMSPLNPFNLIQRPADWIRQTRNKMQVPQTQVQPVNYGLERYNNGLNDGITMVLWEYPQSIRTWKLCFTNPQNDLVNDSDPVYCPWVPIVAMATDIALNERGEEIGEPGTTIDQRAKIHITNAIGIDATFQEYKSEFFPD